MFPDYNRQTTSSRAKYYVHTHSLNDTQVKGCSIIGGIYFVYHCVIFVGHTMFEIIFALVEKYLVKQKSKTLA